LAASPHACVGMFIADFVYTYDDNSNIISQAYDHRPTSIDNIYTYDNLDRLTRAEYLVGVQTENEDFVYDKLGNRTTLKHNGTDVARYQHNDVNEYTYIGLGSGTNVTHDNAGNMTGDHNGYTYHYDYENRLTRVKKSSRVGV